MTTLESFLGSLTVPGEHIIVPKDSVEPLDSNWIHVWFAEAPPGTFGTWRYGHYHAELVGTNYIVHYDKYDPQEHPILHLMFDAHFIAPVCVVAIAASLYYITKSSKVHT